MSKRKGIGIVILVALLALALLASRWLLFTEAGLQFVLARIQHLATVSITTTDARGTIAGSLDAREIVIDHDAVHIVARDVHLRPHLRRILAQVAAIEEATIGSLDVTLKSRPPQPETPPHFLPRFLTLTLQRFSIGSLELTLADGQHFGVAKVEGGRLELTRYRLQLPEYVVEDPSGRIAGAVKAIHTGFDGGLDLETLARCAGMSRSRFVERFKRLVGTSPHNYLVNYRIGVAQQLLAKRLPVKTVAERVGYETTAAFVRKFKEIVGVSPGAWAK